MTTYEDDLRDTHPVDQPCLVSLPPFSPPPYVAPSGALAASKAMQATRRARRLGLAVAALSGAVVALGFAWAVDRG